MALQLALVSTIHLTFMLHADSTFKAALVMIQLLVREGMDLAAGMRPLEVVDLMAVQVGAPRKRESCRIPLTFVTGGLGDDTTSGSGGYSSGRRGDDDTYGGSKTSGFGTSGQDDSYGSRTRDEEGVSYGSGHQGGLDQDSYGERRRDNDY